MIWLRLGCAAALVLAHVTAPIDAAAQRRAPQQPERPLSRILAAATEGALRAHTGFLSDDLLQPRAPGTLGSAITARYLSSQFAAFGLLPAAPGGTFFQPIEMIGLTPEASFVVGSGRRTTAFAHLQDYVAWPERPDSSLTVDGDIVFVGYGVHAPEWNRDDFKGAALAGKILLFLASDPGVADSTVFDGRSLTYYGWWTYKLEQAARAGAVGVILMHADDVAPQSWHAIRNTWSGERLLPRDRRPTTLRFASWMTKDAARRLAQTAGMDLDLLVRRAAASTFAPIELAVRGAMHIRSQARAVTAVNVVARMEGTDPQLRNEAVLYLARYDDTGVTGQRAGRASISGGLADNASGVASLLATAAAFSREPAELRRSLVFLATIGAGPNFLGASAYVAAPALPLERTVAVFNFDGTAALGATDDAVALGAQASSLDAVFAEAVGAEAMEVADDPWPGAGRFFASDHFPFARAGVPTLCLAGGTRYRGRPVGWEPEQLRVVADRDPAKEAGRPPDPDFAGVLQQVRIWIRMGWSLAQTPRFPIWHVDSPYRPAGEQLRVLRERRGR